MRREVTDILVGGMPEKMLGLPLELRETFWDTQSQLYVLKQWDGAFPSPRIEFTAIKTHYATTSEMLDDIYENVEHACDQCMEGMRIGKEGLESGTYGCVAVTIIDYVEEWPDLPGLVQVPKNPLEN